ncbi:substrate-binding domain-containing protein [Hydrocarboniphaga sp.]|uniref:substrate-binding domain-containing protein n=1 Tax=Hydrocarboniphaga sp. TaxID=2033016 RepID=UPI00262B9B1B|nr:substrate-binding domain-containing protein [Hydrocarboniphaga sp.]
MAMMAAAFLSPVAMADIGGGGATLPAKAYSGSSASSTANGPRLSAPAPGSLFYEALPFTTQSYCQTGSGTGRSVLAGTNGNTDASRPCPATFTDAFVNGTNGFSAPSIDADYAASDAPAGTGDFNAFITNKASHEQMTQFPSIAGSISVIANTPGTGLSTVYLTEAEVCNVFAGKITNWSQLAKPNGTAYQGKPIKLVYRSDSSGTSFGFSNHLNWVCSDAALAQTLAPVASTLPFPVASNFSVQSTFASAFPGGVVPANAIAASGNPGVASVVDATDGAFGYVEAANAVAIGSTTFKPVQIAAVDTAAELNPLDGTDTARNTALYSSGTSNKIAFTVPKTFSDKDGNTYNGTYTDRALQSNNASFGRPIGLPTALNTTQAPNHNCVFIVHPGAYATSPYVTAGSPTSGYSSYPIVAVTYLLGNYALNGSADDMRALLGSPYNFALRSNQGGSVNTVGAKTGFAYLTAIQAKPLSGGLVTLDQARVDACTN